ncbi:MAG: 4-phosphopantetheinyl transferase [Candidatus Eremiobacteraeota bacterium]|nr:4-phosphopantetheinyl transferase [Candidatus Eremiobacteraeota bacterium]
MTGAPAAHAHVLRLRPCDAPLAQALHAVLSADERERAARLRFDADRERYVVAHAYMRLILAQHLGMKDPAAVPLQRGAKGEPLIANDERPLRCSLSHAREHVAVAVAPHTAVGIDVEELRDNMEAGQIAQRFFAPEETAELAALAPGAARERFVQLWTCKEAFIKAIGLGLSHPLDGFAVRGLGTSAPHYAGIGAEHGSDAAWTLAAYDLGAGAHAAVAVHAPHARVELSQTPWDTFARAFGPA